MADSLDSETNLGLKRRISELPDTEYPQSILEDHHSNSLSSDQQQSATYSSAKEEKESEESLLNKSKCSPSDESEPKLVQENHETEGDQLGFGNGAVLKMKSRHQEDVLVCELGPQSVSEGAIGLKNCDVGLSGNREFGEEHQQTEGDELGFRNGAVLKVNGTGEDVVVCKLDSQFVSKKERKLKKCDVGSSGNRQFGEENRETEGDALGFRNGAVLKVNGSGGEDIVVCGLDSQFGSEKERKLKNCDVGFSGNRELGESSSRFSSSCVNFDEIDPCVKNKKEECLGEPAVESVSKFAEFNSIRGIMGDNIKIEESLDNSSGVVDREVGTVLIADSDGRGSACDDEKIDCLKGNGETKKCALKIEVIDETAVIDIGTEKGLMNCERNKQNNVMKQETDGKKEKRPRRRGKGVKKLSATNGKENILIHMGEFHYGFGKRGDEAKRGYSRQEMEGLRFVNLEAQRKKWVEVYCGLGPTVAREYDGLIDSNTQKHIQLNFASRHKFAEKEKNTLGILGEDWSQTTDNMSLLDPASGLSASGEDYYAVVERECSEEDDSDDDYTSIQRPAFLVTGEPDFDSGPPQDGLEYLRRVRWEAAQVPKVKVAKLERSKLNKEQTAYMPKIPDIEKCPEHLLPLKQWEDAFIADFSDLRMAFSRLEGSRAEISAKLPFPFTTHQEESSNHLPESFIFEKLDNATTNGVESSEALDFSTSENSIDPQSLSITYENNSSPSPENPDSKSSTGGNSRDGPSLSVILGMDSVARLAMLRKRIGLVEKMSGLSRKDCMWLFALCAAIDTPIDADTCAALRCFLRKCSSLRAGKCELDDEVVMLNILATITGKYFGQSEF